MFQRTRINCVAALEEDRKVGDKMLNLWNEIEELHRETRIVRKLLKIKTKQLQNFRKAYPRIALYSDIMEHDDYYGY